MGTLQSEGNRRGAATLLAMAVVLVIIWPLPHIHALKNILFVTLLGWLVWGQYRDRQFELAKPSLRLHTLSLAVLLFWLFVVAFWVDEDPLRSLDGIKGEWLPAIVSFVIGALLPPTLKRGGMDARHIVRVLFWALIAQAIAQLLAAFWFLVFEGGLPDFFGGLFDHKANITYVTSIALCILVADVIEGRHEKRLLGLSTMTQIAMFAVLTTTTYVSGARIGILIFLLIAVLGAMLYVVKVSQLSKRTMWIWVLIVCVSLSVAVWAMLKVDVRWARFVATVPVAWEVESDHAWLDILSKGLPIAEDGQPVEATAYERIAWARVAQRLLLEYPLGVGVSKSAFKELVEKEYGKTRAAHSHNGYLDFALSVGVPGVALWLLFLALLLWAGVASCRKDDAGGGVALLLLVIGFSVRSILDSTLRDHILEQFMFFAGLLLVVSANGDRHKLTHTNA